MGGRQAVTAKAVTACRPSHHFCFFIFIAAAQTKPNTTTQIIAQPHFRPEKIPSSLYIYKL
jgi:hypothetical protein